MRTRASQLLHRLSERSLTDIGMDAVLTGLLGKAFFGPTFLGASTYAPTVFVRFGQRQHFINELMKTGLFKKHPTKHDHFIYKQDGRVFKLDTTFPPEHPLDIVLPRINPGWGIKAVKPLPSGEEV